MYYLSLEVHLTSKTETKKETKKLFWTGTQLSFIRENAKEFKTHDGCEKALLKLRETHQNDREIFQNLMIDID